MANGPAVSSYLPNLPAGFQVDPFVGRFLLAFERMLSGVIGDDNPAAAALPPGIEDQLASVNTNFDPDGAPDSFLPWLAGWVATSLRQNWDTKLRRDFIANMASLYRKRGTRDYLTDLLNVYLENDNTIVDDSDPTPHFFSVSFQISADPALVAFKSRLARQIIEQEKPAHTFYRLTIKFPTMQIIDNPGPTTGPGITVGVNTILGSGTVTG